MLQGFLSRNTAAPLLLASQYGSDVGVLLQWADTVNATSTYIFLYLEPIVPSYRLMTI